MFENLAGEIKKGVVFRSKENEIFLGYFDNGRISIFNNISDSDGIYNALPLEKIHLVDVSFGDNNNFWIKDIICFEVGSHNEIGEFIPAAVEDMLSDLHFPSDETDSMFASFLNDIGKMH